MRSPTLAVLLGCLGFGPSLNAQAPASGPLEPALRALVQSGAVPGAVVGAAGLTRSGRRLWAIEPAGAADPSKPKVVIIGGLDGTAASTASVMRVLEWWFTNPEAALLRGQWQLAALPCARPDSCEGSPAANADGLLTFPPAGGFFDGKVDPTPHYVWRWTTMQAPTVVVAVRVGWPLEWQANSLAVDLVKGTTESPGGTLVAALGAAGAGAAWSAPVPALQLTARDNAVSAAIADLLRGSIGAISPLRTALVGRMDRPPLDVARLLALRYPAQPIMSYIPALAWSGALRLAQMTGDAHFRDKPLADMAPFLSGRTPAIAEPYLLTSLAGHLAFADLAAMGNNAEADALARKAADFILEPGARNQEAGTRNQEPGTRNQEPGTRSQEAGTRNQEPGTRNQEPGQEIVRFRRSWTDDMFMATSVLARVGARTKDDRYAAAAGRLLTTYAADLQRPDGLFVHAKEGPHAWGRGNGFAAFGLIDALTYLPNSWPDRSPVLKSYQALMRGLVAAQAPDGMWRQVVDEPGSYREFTATAMILTAMARGIRLGWIDGGEFRPAVDRAWRGLLARIAEDGTLVDVCTGTGSGPTRDYYLNRAGITGADDRGGAMGLTAAIEMESLRAGRSR